MNTIIEIRVKDVYGVPTVYPANSVAVGLAMIAGTKTLTHRTLQLAEQLGFTIKQVL